MEKKKEKRGGARAGAGPKMKTQGDPRVQLFISVNQSVIDLFGGEKEIKEWLGKRLAYMKSKAPTS